MNALFRACPGLRETLPHVSLATLPTPVEAMPRLGEAVGAPRLYVKRDDLSAEAYGGNKVRKLEFLLGRALSEGRRTVITFEAAGSNHALATAIYARQLGLDSVSMLVPQPNARYVAANLLRSHAAGAALAYRGGIPRLAAAALAECARRRLRDGRWPLLIGPGGSDPPGIAGFVDAAFELREQVEAGLLPEPAHVYAASGTMGTVVGLVLGLAAAGLRARVIAVRVTDARFTSMRRAKRLYVRTNRLLHAACPAFPLVPFPEDQLVFRHEFFGEEYARFTEAGMAAVRLAEETEGLHLEGTYTGKTLAALIADARAGHLREAPALFWNTYNSRPAAQSGADDYHALPESLHGYFEEPVQPLDQPETGRGAGGT